MLMNKKKEFLRYVLLMLFGFNIRTLSADHPVNACFSGQNRHRLCRFPIFRRVLRPFKGKAGRLKSIV